VSLCRNSQNPAKQCRYYANEKEVGEAVRESDLKRSDVFITTKILFAAGSVEKAYEKALESVHKIDGKDGYVDLFLIHTASGGSKARMEMWLALEKLLEEGKTRAIGTSNWGIGHIGAQRVLRKCGLRMLIRSRYVLLTPEMPMLTLVFSFMLFLSN
jgi:diketogulonate reductase-like aldo/keto reductase